MAIAPAPAAFREPLAAYLDLWPPPPGVLALAAHAVVRQLQRVVGEEAAAQANALLNGHQPDVVVACVWGGSNAAGTFAGFVDTGARLVGVEAAGGAAITNGIPGILHGMHSKLLQDEAGQIEEAESISAGLDYPGLGPEHAHLAAIGRAEYTTAADDEVLDAFTLLSQTEGIIHYSADTMDKELALITARARDAVATFLSTDYLMATVAGLERKARVPVTHPDRTVRMVAKAAKFSDETADAILGHFVTATWKRWKNTWWRSGAAAPARASITAWSTRPRTWTRCCRSSCIIAWRSQNREPNVSSSETGLWHGSPEP